MLKYCQTKNQPELNMTALLWFILIITLLTITILTVFIGRAHSYSNTARARVAIIDILTNREWVREEDVFNDLHQRGVKFTPKRFRDFMFSLEHYHIVESIRTPQTIDNENINLIWYRIDLNRDRKTTPDKIRRA